MKAGGKRVNTRKLVRLFFTTLLLGGLVTLITSFFVNFDLYVENLRPFNGFGLLGLVYWYVLYGFIYSIISQAGFFAFFFINWIGLSIFCFFLLSVYYVLVVLFLFYLF